MYTCKNYESYAAGYEDGKYEMYKKMKHLKENNIKFGLRIKKKLYGIVLQSILRNAYLLGLTGKQRSQVLSLILKCEE